MIHINANDVMRIKKKNPKLSKVLKICTWCGKSIPKNEEIFSLGAKSKPGVDLSKYEGKVIPIKIISLNKTIFAIVPMDDSDSKREGNDFMFVLCSRECGYELKDVLEEEKSLGELLKKINILQSGFKSGSS